MPRHAFRKGNTGPENKRVKFTAALWKVWLDRFNLEDEQTLSLRAGIRDFRQRLNKNRAQKP